MNCPFTSESAPIPSPSTKILTPGNGSPESFSITIPDIFPPSAKMMEPKSKIVYIRNIVFITKSLIILFI